MYNIQIPSLYGLNLKEFKKKVCIAHDVIPHVLQISFWKKKSLLKENSLKSSRLKLFLSLLSSSLSWLPCETSISPSVTTARKWSTTTDRSAPFSTAKSPATFRRNPAHATLKHNWDTIFPERCASQLMPHSQAWAITSWSPASLGAENKLNRNSATSSAFRFLAVAIKKMNIGRTT